MPADVKILGKWAAIAQPPIYRYDPIRGYETVLRWRGTKDKILPLLGAIKAGGGSYEYSSQDGVVYDVTATYGAAGDGSVETPVDIWESTANITGKDILDSPACAGLSDVDIGKIINWFSAPPASGTPPTVTGDALTAFQLKAKGVGYKVIQPILRHTQIVSNSYAVAAAYTNVGGIFATGSLGVPSSFLSNLPSGGAGTSGVPGGSHFGWYKNPPQVQIAAYSKTQIIQEFEFGEWSTFLYGGLL